MVGRERQKRNYEEKKSEKTDAETQAVKFTGASYNMVHLSLGCSSLDIDTFPQS